NAGVIRLALHLSAHIPIAAIRANLLVNEQPGDRQNHQRKRDDRRGPPAVFFLFALFHGRCPPPVAILRPNRRFRALWRARSRSHRRGGGFRRAAHSPRVRTCAGGRRALCRLGGAARASRGRAGLSRVRGSSVHESLLLLLLVFPPRSALSFSMP